MRGRAARGQAPAERRRFAVPMNRVEMPPSSSSRWRLAPRRLSVAAAIAATALQPIREPRGYIVDAGAGAIGAARDRQPSTSSTPRRRDAGPPDFRKPVWPEDLVLRVQHDGAQTLRATAYPRTFGTGGEVRRGGECRLGGSHGDGPGRVLSPDGDATPTLGRERSFLEDLFGNIGAVGAAGCRPGPVSRPAAAGAA